jgi:hypothetical protein
LNFVEESGKAIAVMNCARVKIRLILIWQGLRNGMKVGSCEEPMGQFASWVSRMVVETYR